MQDVYFYYPLFYRYKMAAHSSAPLKKVSTIKFELMGSQYIKDSAVCFLTHTNLSGPGSVYDPLMGVSHQDKDKSCKTCEGDILECTGHPGAILLNEPILHPNYLEDIKNILRLQCSKCLKLMVKKPQAKLYGFHTYPPAYRFKKSLELIAGYVVCHYCDEAVANYEIDDMRIKSYFEDKKKGVEVPVREIENRFGKMDKKERLMCGIMIDPVDLIISAVQVLPPACRPSVKAGNNVCDDDLTNKYIDIIKANEKMDKPEFKNKRNEFAKNIEFHVATMFDNTKNKARQITSNRPIKSIKQRLTGKGGLFRNNLMGKRVDFSARTVFNVCPSLGVDQVGLPEEWRHHLTFPEHVHEGNREYWEQEANKGNIVNIIRDKKTIRVSFAATTQGFKLLYTDKVYRTASEIVCCDKLSFFNKLMKDRKIDVVFRKCVDYVQTSKIGRIIYNLEKVYDIASSKESMILQVGDKIYRNDRKHPEKNISPEIYEIMKERKFQLNYKDRVKRHYTEMKDGESGKVIKSLVLPQKKKVEINAGDIVERKLKDGDVVMYNRQPSLHKLSILTGKVKFMKQKSMTLNTCICAPLNADCDGDELNIHVPQTLQTKAEVLELCSVKNNLTGGRDSSSVIGICQDSLTGGYLSTKGDRVYYLTSDKVEQLKNKKIESPMSECSKTMNKLTKKNKELIEKQKVLQRKKIEREKDEYVKESKKSCFVKMARDVFMGCLCQVADWDDVDMFKKMEHVKKVYAKEKNVKNEEGWFEDVFEKYETIEIVKGKKVKVVKERMVKTEYVPSEIEENYLFTGHGLFSMLLPDDLEIKYDNMVKVIYINGKKTMEPVVIKEGVMLSGSIDKSLVGKKHGSLIQVLSMDYGNEVCMKFAGNYQNVIDHYLLDRGFSIGIQDCFSGLEDEKGNDLATLKANQEMNSAFLEAKHIYENETDQKMLERKINGILNKVVTVGEVIAKGSLRRDNAFANMIVPGAKGNFVNVSQIITCLGQQNVGGERVNRLFKARTLPHFPKDPNFLKGKKNEKESIDFTGVKKEDELEHLRQTFRSRGFGDKSLIEGLHPTTFFFHAQSGREGIISTAVKTSDGGYISRCLVKKQEDSKSNYHGTITNSYGSTLTFDYNNGFDPSLTVNIGGEQLMCDVKRLVNKYNKQYELKIGKHTKKTGDETFDTVNMIEEMEKTTRMIKELENSIKL